MQKISKNVRAQSGGFRKKTLPIQRSRVPPARFASGHPTRRKNRRVLIGSEEKYTGMTLIKKHRVRTKKTLVDTLPEMLLAALANHEDFVVTYETDPETKKRSLYIMSGSLIRPEMLASLKQEIERKKEEGSTIVTRDWK
jgi:hypothetical protein